MGRIRQRLSYANVTATLALFIALGGTSYAALSLPRNSVGAAQLRTNSVGGSELRHSAVRSADIKDRAIRLRDVAPSARSALQGQTGPQGPPGPTFFATVKSSGGLAAGNATTAEPFGTNGVLVGFARSTTGCAPAATLTSTPGGPNPVPPPTAHVTAELGSGGRVLIRTWAANGSAVAYPFNVVVAC